MISLVEENVACHHKASILTAACDAFGSDVTRLDRSRALLTKFRFMIPWKTLVIRLPLAYIKTALHARVFFETYLLLSHSSLRLLIITSSQTQLHTFSSAITLRLHVQCLATTPHPPCSRPLILSRALLSLCLEQ